MGRIRFSKIFQKKIFDQILKRGKVVYTFYVLTDSSGVLNRQQSMSGEPFGWSGPDDGRAAPLGRGRTECRPVPAHVTAISAGRGGARGMLGLVVALPLPSSLQHPPPPSSPRSLHCPAGRQRQAVVNVRNRSADVPAF